MNLQEKNYLNKIISSLALVLNEDHTIKYINDFGLKKLDLNEQDAVGKPFSSLENDIEALNNSDIAHFDSENWEKIFNTIPMPVFIKDRQHRWVFFNDALCSLQNKTRLELQDKNDYDFFPKTQADRFWEEEETVFQTGKEIFTEEPSLRNGIDSYVLIKKTIIKTKDNIEYLIGCCIDITKRKKAELALIENERRFRSLIQHSPDIITILGKNHVIKYITPSFYRLSGFTEIEIIGTSILDYLHQDDINNYLKIINKIVDSSDKGSRAEIRIVKKNGEYIVLESFFKDLSIDPAIDGIVINSSDVTSIRNQTKEIERINKLLEAENHNLKVELKIEVEAKVDLKPLSFNDFKKIYPDDAACLKYLADLKWKDGFTCKKCGNNNYGHGKFNYARRCTRCGYEETVSTHTIFYRIKFPILNAFYMFFLLRSHQNITAKNLSILTLMKENTCSSFKRKIKAITFNNNSITEDWESQILIKQ